MADIVFTSGSFDGQKLELPDTGITLGKADDADLVLDDAQVSGQHAQLRMEDGAWCLFDLESTNGTMVNGEPITAVVLNEDDVVTLGETQFTFKANGAAAAAAEEAPAESPVAEESPAEALPTAEDAAPAEPEPKPEPEPTPKAESKSPASKKTKASSAEDVALVEEMKLRADKIRSEVGKVIVGQREVLDQVMMCIIASGHALLIGLPGMAKTLMVSTIAQVLNMEFKRVQFTPDLMPTDIVGSDVLETNRETGDKEFRFIKGPIFCNLLLADEINRTPPKTQAALLEAMQEKRVTAGNTTYTLDKPFFVLATQNPIEQEGTYPLPEAQLDRFMFNIWVDYPLQNEEEEIIGATTTGDLREPNTIMTKEEVLQLQAVVKKIPVSEHVIKYVIRIVRATRPQYDDAPEITKKYISTGAGPRAGQNLILAAKAMAVLEGRIHVSCADIRRACPPVLRHRLLTNFAADSEGLNSIDLVTKLLEIVKEPGEEEYDPQPEAPPKGKKEKKEKKEKDKKEKDKKGKKGK